jgi:hypothetical protein
MNLQLFLLINFVVSFISDLVLNFLSTNYSIVPSLKPYYHQQSVIKLGIYAGITVVVGLLVTLLLYYILFGLLLPNNYKSLMYFCIFAFVIGYVLDIIIYKMKLFGNKLDRYYKELGAGFWGATAFIFSIIISYFIQKNIIM